MAARAGVSRAERKTPAESAKQVVRRAMPAEAAPVRRVARARPAARIQAGRPAKAELPAAVKAEDKPSLVAEAKLEGTGL